MTRMLTVRSGDRVMVRLPCCDRLTITDMRPATYYMGVMTSYFYSRGIRVLDYARYIAGALRDCICGLAQACAEVSIGTEYINKPRIRKEDSVATVLSHRGDHVGSVYVISEMETCDAALPRQDKSSGETFLKPDLCKSKHYEISLFDESLDHCHLRVFTWRPLGP